MELRLRRQLRVKAVLAGVSTALFALTLVFPEWIEATTGLEPDAGSGSLERIIAAAFLVVALVSAVLTRRDHRRLNASVQVIPLRSQESG